MLLLGWLVASQLTGDLQLLQQAAVQTENDPDSE